MTGKCYYLTTLGDWQRHAARFANSHFIALDSASEPSPSDATQILALVEADEGAHLALEDDAAFEPLPHPLAQKPISDRAQAALAPLGVAPAPPHSTPRKFSRAFIRFCATACSEHPPIVWVSSRARRLCVLGDAFVGAGLNPPSPDRSQHRTNPQKATVLKV